MINILLAAAIAAAPAPQAAPTHEHKGHAGQQEGMNHGGMNHGGMKHEGMKHEGPCCDEKATKDCCKGDKPMPCCQKAAEKPAEAPAAEAGGHDHAH